MTAVVTPFDHEQQVDEEGFTKMINYLLKRVVHRRFPVGSQGEFFSLTSGEKIRGQTACQPQISDAEGFS
jgi:dihydrodipicolinate synthase/N-acetylneuraminate lyase